MLLGQSNDVKVVVMYNVTFLWAAPWPWRRRRSFCTAPAPAPQRWRALWGYNLLYLLLILLGGGAARWHLLLGLLTGLADGCYWLSYGHLLADATDLSNRDSGIAIISIFANLVNLTVPLLASFVIDRVGGTKGYITVFAMAFAVSLVTCALALRLPKHHTETEHHVDYPLTFRAIARNRHLIRPCRPELQGRARGGVHLYPEHCAVPDGEQ